MAKPYLSIKIAVWKLIVGILGGLLSFPLWFILSYIVTELFTVTGKIIVFTLMMNIYTGMLAVLPFFIYEYRKGSLVFKANRKVIISLIFISFFIYTLMHLFELQLLITPNLIATNIILQQEVYTVSEGLLIHLLVVNFATWVIWFLTATSFYQLTSDYKVSWKTLFTS